MTDLFNTLLEVADNEYASIVEDGIIAGDISGYVDTGSYSFNALLSGSIYGGVAANKVTAFAGEPSTGKTFFALSTIKQFLEANPTGFVFYFESESAISKDMMVQRGIDVSRVAIMPVVTIQDFRTQAVRIASKYAETKKDRPPIFFVLDSLGNLSTQKEVEDIESGSDKRDMTKAQLIKGAFRVLTLKIGLVSIPMIVTNHVYDVIGSYVPVKKMNGGSGLEYAASCIIYFSKKKDREDGKDADVTGAIIKAVLKKSRLSIENKSVEMLLRYDSGLDRYYGLTDLAIKFGVWKKMSTKIDVYCNGTDKGVFEKEINRNPEKYFTKEVLDKIDGFCKEEFLYGNTSYTEEETE